MNLEWSFDSGWATGRDTYYATACRDLPQQVRIDGILRQHEYIIEFGDSPNEAEEKVKQRIEQL